MWAMVVQKGEKPLTEGHSKSAGFNSWGPAVLVRAEVPLVPPEGELMTPDRRNTRSTHSLAIYGRRQTAQLNAVFWLMTLRMPTFSSFQRPLYLLTGKADH